MQIDGNPYPLDAVGVESVPDKPGVYSLQLRDEVVYYGVAEHSLRDVIRTHAEAERARLNRREALTGFTFECPPDPDRRRRELTFRFVASRGQLPRRNAQEARARASATEEADRRTA